jgi:hypothetical protein
MAEVIDVVRDLKKRAQAEREQGNHHIAAQTLHQAVDLLEDAMARRKAGGHDSEVESGPAPPVEIGLAAQLVDIYGMLGGRRRAEGDLVGAIAAYDAGFQYESIPRYGFKNSYNALNRLVTRVLLSPSSLTDPNALRKHAEVAFVDVPATLSELQVQLERQVKGVRANDCWAAGDLALTCALNGDDGGAFDALASFASCTPPPPSSAYQSYASSMGMLAKLDTPRREVLTRAREWLEQKSH